MSESNKANIGKQAKSESSSKSGKKTLSRGVPSLVGWKTEDISSLDNAYKVCIHSEGLRGGKGVTVVAALQDKTTFRVTSEWEGFAPIGDIKLLNQGMQLFGQSGVTKLSSRRIWKGTSPVTLNLKLNFQSMDNTWVNVVCPYLALMQMILPGKGKGGMKYNLPVIGGGTIESPFLTPPGPGPYGWEKGSKVGGKVVTGLKGGDKISVGIGKFLFLNSVIVREIVPVFDNRVDIEGLPISAEITVVLESYEIMTKNDMLSAFNSGGNGKMLGTGG